MVVETLSQFITVSSNIISQNIIIILILLALISLVFSKRRKTLIATFVIIIAIYVAAFLLNINGLSVIEIAVPFSIAMMFFSSWVFYVFLIISIILMLSAPSISILGAGVSLGVITPFFGETIINKIEELGWILNE